MGPLSGSHLCLQLKRLQREALFPYTTLFRSEKVRVFPLQSGRRPYMCHARKERAEVNGTDQRITSGPAATTAAIGGAQHCTPGTYSRRGQSLALEKRAPSIHVPREERTRGSEWDRSADHICACS